MQKRTRKEPQPTRIAADPEGKLRSMAGQEWDTERMDRVSDRDIDAMQLDEEILRQAGERKGAHRKTPRSTTGLARRPTKR
jgi:hypothetical protein